MNLSDNHRYKNIQKRYTMPTVEEYERKILEKALKGDPAQVEETLAKIAERSGARRKEAIEHKDDADTLTKIGHDIKRIAEESELIRSRISELESEYKKIIAISDIIPGLEERSEAIYALIEGSKSDLQELDDEAGILGSKLESLSSKYMLKSKKIEEKLSIIRADRERHDASEPYKDKKPDIPREWASRVADESSKESERGR